MHTIYCSVSNQKETYFVLKMFRFWNKFKRRKYRPHDIDPDEIFLDSANLMNFDKDQFEGRIERPISKQTLAILYLCFLGIFSALLYKVFMLQVIEGSDLYELSENNRLREKIMFATRGNIYDRNSTPIAWNEPQAEGADFAKRVYTPKNGLSGLLGFVTYPKKDTSGFYYELNYQGKEGIEKQFEHIIGGVNGSQLIETNALGDQVSNNMIRTPDPGDPLYLSIDADVQEQLYNSMKEIAEQVGFGGGGGVIMNVQTGEILALTSYPEYNSQRIVDGDSEYLKQISQDSANPFLNRVTQGLYTPGSIVKPFVAIAALNEGTITEYTQVLSTKQLEVPNPYNPDNPSYFSDWKAHGMVDVKRAIAVSSNIFFYVVGGGFGNIEGVGITRLDEYYRKFGFGSSVEGQVSSQYKGTIPNPEWKTKNFNGDIWRLGDTFFTSIGQYGFQATPLQAVRAVGAIANKGTVLNPTILKGADRDVAWQIDDIRPDVWRIVHEGMRQGVTSGTVTGLNLAGVTIAAKTGTAELGVSKDNVNSWATGFWPYENPKYAFAIVMEKGKRTNLIGSVFVARKVFEWMTIHRPEYLQ